MSVFIAFALLKWLEGVITVLGYMWDNTVGARCRRLAAEEKAEAIEQGREQGRAEVRAKIAKLAEQDAEIALLKARIAELERDRNGE